MSDEIMARIGTDTPPKKERGGSAYTSVTGTPGLPGGPRTSGTSETTPHLSLVKGNRQSPEALHEQVRNERINMFVGITGAAGLSGTVEVNDKGEITSPISDEVEAVLNNLALKKIDTMGADELKDLIIANNDAINTALSDLDAHNGNRAYTVGKALLRVEYIQSSRNLKNGFESWCEANLKATRLKKRTRQKYMEIARITDALDYLVLGIEKLADLVPALKREEGLDPEHPIRSFAERFKVDLKACGDVEEMRFEIGLGVALAKLERNRITVSKEAVRKYLECGFEVTRKDIEAMKAATDSGGDPVKYLERVIKNKQRPRVAGTDANKPPRNFQEQAQEIRDTVATLLKAPSVSKDIQIDRIDALIQDLEALKHRLSGSQPIVNAAADSPAEPAPSAPLTPSQDPSIPAVAAVSSK
jgi:hypothetical protein